MHLTTSILPLLLPKGTNQDLSRVQKLTDFTSYADAQRRFSTARLWDLFDGTRDRLNIASECVDRHAAPGLVALRVAHADGHAETITFTELAAWSSRFAHWLTAQ